jgi:hypothetical protein
MVEQEAPVIAPSDESRVAAVGARRRSLPLVALRYGWPIVALLGVLWFPFDWLAQVWPPFGAPFRMVFHNAHDHFVGHTVFFCIVGALLLGYIPAARRQPLWYALGLALAALAQETVQAIFRGEAPTFNDFNAFRGDALGGVAAFALWAAIALIARLRRAR